MHRKGVTGSELCFMGLTPMKNRNGLLVFANKVGLPLPMTMAAYNLVHVRTPGQVHPDAAKRFFSWAGQPLG